MTCAESGGRSVSRRHYSHSDALASRCAAPRPAENPLVVQILWSFVVVVFCKYIICLYLQRTSAAFESAASAIPPLRRCDCKWRNRRASLSHGTRRPGAETARGVPRCRSGISDLKPTVKATPLRKEDRRQFNRTAHEPYKFGRSSLAYDAMLVGSTATSS